MAVYFSILEVGDTILAMNLSHGGHLTHGSPVNFSGRFFNIIPYGVNKDSGRIDYEKLRDLALKINQINYRRSKCLSTRNRFFCL